MENIYDIVIVGAGPAGLTAALYARRAGRTVLLIEKESFGGQIVLSPLVENYPLARPASGVELVDDLISLVTSLGAKFELDTVIGVSKNNDGTLEVKTEYSVFTARTLIIATGLKHRRLGLEGEERFVGKGISFCAVCDGNFFKDQTVAVVGGGNTAVQDAVYLSRICKKVYLIHRRDRFRAEKRVVESLNSCVNVETIMNSHVTGITGDKRIEGIVVQSMDGETQRELSISGLFVAVGQEPGNSVFRDLVELDEAGFIAADENCTTRQPNIFVAGDCRTKNVRQLVTASADGGVAAIAASEYLDSIDEIVETDETNGRIAEKQAN